MLLDAHWMLIRCSLDAHWMLLRCSSDAPWMLIGWVLDAPLMLLWHSLLTFEKMSTSVCGGPFLDALRLLGWCSILRRFCTDESRGASRPMLIGVRSCGGTHPTTSHHLVIIVKTPTQPQYNPNLTTTQLELGLTWIWLCTHICCGTSTISPYMLWNLHPKL